MRFDKLDLNLLVALDALIGEKSVTGAAKRLFLSQPAVTSALNRLRDYFGDELLVLEGRQMRLTSKAEQLAAPVKQTLELIRAEITQPGNFDPATSTRRFVIIASDYMQTVLLADAIAAISHCAPSVTVEILRPSVDAEERFERAELDFMITVRPFALDQHPSADLFSDEHVLVSWAEAGYEDEITQEVFLNAGHVAAAFGRERRPALSELSLDHLGERRRLELIVPSFSALAQSVVGTNRLAMLHRRLAAHFAQLYPIRLHRVPVPIDPIEEVIQWHRLRAQDQGMKWFRDQILDLSARKFSPTHHSGE